VGVHPREKHCTETSACHGRAKLEANPLLSRTHVLDARTPPRLGIILRHLGVVISTTPYAAANPQHVSKVL